MPSVSPPPRLWRRGVLLLPDGQVLAVGGISPESQLPSKDVDRWDPKTAKWTSVAPMLEPQRWPMAALTPEGRVLAVDASPNLSYPPATREIESWDPQANIWSAVGTFTSSAAVLALVPLSKARVAIIETPNVLRILDMRSKKWTMVAPPLTRADGIPVPLLAVVPVERDRVMAFTAPSRAWMWSPSAPGWKEVPGPPVDSIASAFRGHDGTVFALNRGSKSAARLPPSGASWSIAALPADADSLRSHFPLADDRFMSPVPGDGLARIVDLAAGRVEPAGALPCAPSGSEDELVGLNDGTALYISGISSERWIPEGEEAGAFAVLPSVVVKTYERPAQLADRTIVIAGGNSQRTGAWAKSRDPSIRTWQPTEGDWAELPPMLEGRAKESAFGLADGRLLVVGGVDTSKPFGVPCRPGAPDRVLSSTEIFDRKTSRWISAGSLRHRQYAPTLLGLEDGRVLAINGTICISPQDTTSCGNDLCWRTNIGEVWDPAHPHEWREIAPALVKQPQGATAVVMGDGRVLLVGGAAPGEPQCELWNPTTNRWTVPASQPKRRSLVTATTLADGRVLVAGGETAGTEASLADAEVFDPRAERWTQVAPMLSGRREHSATLLTDGRVLVAGGRNFGTCILRAEVWDPSHDTWSTAGSVGGAGCGSDLFPLDGGAAVLVNAHEPLEVWRPQ